VWPDGTRDIFRRIKPGTPGSSPGPPLPAGIPPSPARSRWWSGSHLLPAHVPVQRRPVRDRLQPGGRAAGPHSGRPAGVRRLCVIGAIADVLWATQYGTIDSTADTACELRVVP
jgi:hypothetical protein